MKNRVVGGNKIWIKLFYIIAILLLFPACNHVLTGESSKPVRINMNDTSIVDNAQSYKDSIPYLRVAVSAMISPKETVDYYQKLFNYISRKAGEKIKMVQRMTYSEVNHLLNNNQVDMAFICSGAYVRDRQEGHPIKIVAIPVVKGFKTYQAYIITYKLSGINKFENLKGKSFAFTDPLSNTGYFYPVSRIEQLGYNKNTFFKDYVFTHAHDISMQLVAKQLVDGASVDGLIYNYLKVFYPEQLSNIQVIGKSQPFGMPPIVAPASTPDSILKKFRNILFAMDKDSLGVKILRKLMIDKFVPANDSLYNSIRLMDKQIFP